MHKRKRKAIASEIGQFFIEILCFSYRKTFFKNFEILWTGFVDLNIVENCKQYCGRYKYVNFQYSAFDDVLRNFTESPVSECDINRTENLPCCIKIAFQSDYFE
ncbi:conserved hypothetical protein [Trichinella spiralis]|uniref:hypothetical protein n=1 Tax=Trichinella spiralis TaxID=6334 RepID=UPI0001EFDE94|nr:conserved hypothetical protein [Trichinella spiralis]